MQATASGRSVVRKMPDPSPTSLAMEQMSDINQIHSLAVPRADLLEEPRHGVPQTSEILRGERLRVLELGNAGWWKVENLTDGQVGWLPPVAACNPVEPGDPPPSHRVRGRMASLHPAPTHKAVPVGALSMNSLVDVVETDTNGWCCLSDGLWVFGKLLEPASQPRNADPVETALRFLETPYVWGGRSAFGIDCSGLVLTAMATAGVITHHSSGKQRLDEALGPKITDDGRDVEWQRGDIVFFPGHVGFMLDDRNLLHATVFTMSVVIEPLADVVARADGINGGRRPQRVAV